MIDIFVNILIYGVVVAAAFFVYKKYDKKLLEEVVITEKQFLISIVGALFASVVAVNILNILTFFLLGETLLASIIGLLFIVAQFYIIYYGIIILFEKQKVMLSKKAAHLLAHKMSLVMIISLIVTYIAFGIMLILFGYMSL